MIELLSPAGDIEKLKYAFMYGADAVYIGGVNYSLRANAKNFSNEDIKNAVEYAHNINKKVYVTVNIVLHNSIYYCNKSRIMHIFYTIFPMPTL